MSCALACATGLLFQLCCMASSFSAVNWVMSHLMPHQKSHTRSVGAGLIDIAGGGTDDVAIGIRLLAFKI